MSSSPGAEPLRPAAPRVVIADDDALFRSGVRAALQDAGIVVIAEADNGRDAIDLAVHFRPDVVLMDVVMVGDGRDLRHARDRRRARRRSASSCSPAREDAELGMIGLRAGADGHLVKGLAYDDARRRGPRRRRRRAGRWRRPSLRRLIERLRALPDGGLGVRPVRSTLTSREWEVLDLLCAGLTVDDDRRSARPRARHRPNARKAHPAQARRALAGRGHRDGERDPGDLRARPPRAPRAEDVRGRRRHERREVRVVVRTSRLAPRVGG